MLIKSLKYLQIIYVYYFVAPCSPNNSSDSEEEMEVQHWRVQSYLQEEYLKTIRSKVGISHNNSQHKLENGM